MDLASLVLALVPLFVVVDPLASIGLYLGLTGKKDRRTREAIALRASLFAAAVLVVFAVAGRAILTYLGIELYSLRVAGGLLLVLIGLNMLREGEEVSHKEIEELELPTGGTYPTKAVAAPHDPSFVPLGLPMLAGPGAISLIIVQATEFDWVTMAVSIALTMAGAFLILVAASRASNIIGDNARRVITRIMGLLTVAFAVQYVFDGINGWMAA